MKINFLYKETEIWILAGKSKDYTGWQKSLWIATDCLTKKGKEMEHYEKTPTAANPLTYLVGS
jgi:hypothetical protein